eukprot:1954833-Prymnesium_polylepis.2
MRYAHQHQSPPPATPKRKSPVGEEGTSSGKKKKQSHDNLKAALLGFECVAGALLGHRRTRA